MTRQEKVEIEYDGRVYRGHYLVSNGGVAVASAYGSMGVKLKPNENPHTVAAKLLQEIVKAWRA